MLIIFSAEHGVPNCSTFQHTLESPPRRPRAYRFEAEILQIIYGKRDVL